MNSTSDNAQYMNKGAAYALLARAANYYGSVDCILCCFCKCFKMGIDNWPKAAVGPSGYMATWYTDNAVNALFEIAASGTDNKQS